MNSLDSQLQEDNPIDEIRGDTHHKVDSFWEGVGSVGSFAARNIRGALGASRRTISSFLFRNR